MSFHRPPPVVAAVLVAALALLGGRPATAQAADPWADTVVHYSAGTNAEPDYDDAPNNVLGSPERVTGENSPFGPFPGATTVFSGAFGLDEIVSVGAGGELIVRFDEPVINRPGSDLIIFGNSFFSLDSDTLLINGLNAEPGNVEVSTDGVDWRSTGGFADALFPTQGYLDAGIFGDPVGSLPTDFLKPMNSALTLNDFLGKSYSEALALYDGSGGGAPIDFGATGLTSIQYVRVSLPADSLYSTEIDAFAAIPEPATGVLLIGAGLLVGLRRRRATPSSVEHVK